MNVLCIVQARYGSSRLPGKVLQQIGELTMLERVLTRLSRSVEIDNIVVATTTEPSDDPVVLAAQSAGVAVSRGPEFDVLDRFRIALNEHPTAEVVVRVTADCPFIDPEVVDLLVRDRAEHDADFVANRLPPPFRRTYPVGLDVEVCTADVLRRASEKAVLPHQREHVMPYIYENQDEFSIRVLQLDEDLSRFRWTVDTPEDLEVARKLAEKLDPEPFGWRDALQVALQNPSIGVINADQVQKVVSEVDQRWNPSGGIAPD